MYRQPLSAEMIESMGLPQQVLDGLVDQRLLLQEATKLHLNATPEEVRKRILQIPTLNPEGHFVGAELYNRYITGSLGYQSTAEFEDEMAKDITVRKMESAMANSIVVSPKAAEEEYRRVSENAKIKYVLLATREAPMITVTPAEVEQYYKANQAKYAHGEQRALKYLLADTNRIRSQIIPTDASCESATTRRRKTTSVPPRRTSFTSSSRSIRTRHRSRTRPRRPRLRTLSNNSARAPISRSSRRRTPAIRRQPAKAATWTSSIAE